MAASDLQLDEASLSAFDIASPAAGAPSTPLVFASPHSGRLYPDDMGPAASLDRRAMRGSEDALVDELLAGAPARGVTVIRARYARAYVDVNREAYELDQAMFADRLPVYARARTARVAAGLGSIARVAADGQEIYDRKLTFAEAARRIRVVHDPYHAALKRLLEAARARHGFAVLIDWHSMPSAAVRAEVRLQRSPDVVLGDRYGAACAPALIAAVEAAFAEFGVETARNTPYAGGYTTETYGRPRERLHALQVEINRALYLDETDGSRGEGFAALANTLGALFDRMAAFDWPRFGLRA